MSKNKRSKKDRTTRKQSAKVNCAEIAQSINDGTLLSVEQYLMMSLTDRQSIGTDLLTDKRKAMAKVIALTRYALIYKLAKTGKFSQSEINQICARQFSRLLNTASNGTNITDAKNKRYVVRFKTIPTRLTNNVEKGTIVVTDVKNPEFDAESFRRCNELIKSSDLMSDELVVSRLAAK